MIQVYIDNDTAPTNIAEIMFDDTISMIKQKIFHKTNIPIEEMYLYCAVRVKLSALMVYSLLSLNGKVGVLSVSLNSFLNNIISPSGFVTELKQRITRVEKDYPNTIYSFKEITELIPDIIVTLKKPLGMSFNNRPNVHFMDNILLSADPYSVKDIPDRYVVYSNNEEVLLRYIGDMQMPETTIHVCTITELLKHYNHQSLIELIHLYFPKYDKVKLSIKDVEKDVKNQSAVFNQISKKLYKSNVKYFESLDFWNMFLEENLNPAEKCGITRLHFNYKGCEPNTRIPLEYIFKCINSSEHFPLIRYVLSKRREPFVRLYSPYQSNYDKNVPILSIADVNRIFTTFGKNAGIQVFMPFSAANINCFFVLKETGLIEVLFETTNNTPIDATNNLLSLIDTTLNLFINHINIILKQSDLFILPIKDIMVDTEFKSMDWVSLYPLNNSKDIMSSTKTSYMMNVFYNPNKEKKKTEKQKEKIKKKEKDELNFYFTRVSNFNVDSEMESNTNIKVWYSVDSHMLYVKATNIKSYQYILTIPKYLDTFVISLLDTTIYEQLKDSSTTIYSYNTYKGEDFMIEPEDESEKEYEEMEEMNEIDKLIMEQLLKSEEKEENEEDISVLGDLESLSDLEEREREDEVETNEQDEDDEEELGDLDDDEI
jgi:hypothetical protein